MPEQKETKGDDKNKRVKINVEGEDEIGEGEMGRKKMKRFVMPNVPRWWQLKVIQYAFAHPHVRARLEKHMGSNLVRLTDKAYMTELEDRIRAVNEENLNKRISSRVLDEMERLKRLILVGKTPLKECPPELYHHPVFVFWRMVNKEVQRASKKRADAFYRKLKASQMNVQTADEDVEAVEEETESEQLTPQQLLDKVNQDLELQKAADIEKGVRFTDDQFALIKYETQDVKTLKTLTTVEELYALADKIIGTKRI
ncbi:uncharacterized protein LOC133517647 isoform X1 [Cydia pomonella]|uniref:uncharacterized protein LOC133517647 isoform X1 n=1 Tax=Cydia pomonella TaxID=82600 RepID=UPI002ADDF64C|nr:uncharacterized protein LOC133517647 isoform X1 [Cydia pomonella]XP_061706984.1 uncharacterized protein LOC133517647 isoform X1 [Cydia pomonella]